MRGTKGCLIFLEGPTKVNAPPPDVIIGEKTPTKTFIHRPPILHNNSIYNNVLRTVDIVEVDAPTHPLFVVLRTLLI